MDNHKNSEIKIEELEEWYKKEQESLENQTFIVRDTRKRILANLEDTFHSAKHFLEREDKDNVGYEILQHQYNSLCQSVEDEYTYHDRKIRNKLRLIQEEYRLIKKELGESDGKEYEFNW